MVVSRRNGPAAGDPGQDVGVALVEQRLEPAELGLVHGRDVGSREAADKEVGLELAAVAAAVQQALPAGLGGLGQGGSNGRCCDASTGKILGLGTVTGTAKTAEARAAERPTEALRPEPLFPVFAPVRGLPGVGPATERLLARLLDREEPRRFDLATHLPVGLIDPRPLPSLAGVRDGDAVTLELRVRRHRPGAGQRTPYRVEAEAAGQPVDLVFFRTFGDEMRRRYPEGGTALVHGRLGRFRDRWQITHPDLLDPAKGSAPLPLYRLTEGLTQGRLRPVIKAALDRLPALPEWLGSDLAGARRWPSWTEALRLAHGPATAAELEPDAPARQRLAYDELLAGQLALALVRQRADRGARPLAQG